MAAAADTTADWPPFFDGFTTQTKQDYRIKYRQEFTHPNPFEHHIIVLLRLLVVLNTTISRTTFQDYVNQFMRIMIHQEKVVDIGASNRIFPQHNDDNERNFIIIPRLNYFCLLLAHNIKLLIRTTTISEMEMENLIENIQSFYSLVANKYRDDYAGKNSTFSEYLHKLRDSVSNLSEDITIPSFVIRKKALNSSEVVSIKKHTRPCRYGSDCRQKGNQEHNARFSHPPEETLPEEVDGGGKKRRTKRNKRFRYSVSFKSKRTRTRSYRRN